MRSILFILSFFILSCGSVRVAYDYDSSSDFSSYNTYAFSKEQIENLEISDIDKKRILKAIDVELYNKGLRKSSIEPDIIVNFYNKTNKKISFRVQVIYKNFGKSFKDNV